MKIREFAEEIRSRITGKIEDVVEIAIKPVLKNNGKKLTAFVFKERVQKATPTIYLEDFYQEYAKAKRELDEIAGQIIGIYEKYRVREDVDMSFVQDWEKVKDKVVYRLINKEQNKKLLKQIPYEEILDLAKVFYLAFDNDSFMMIHHGICKAWGITKEELIKAAEENTPRLFPVKIMEPEDVIRKIFNIEETETMFSSVRLYFVSNHCCLYGAGAIFYSEILAELAEKLNSDLYLFPSSIHEMGVTIADEELGAKRLIEIVRDVNKCVVNTEEYLGNNIYLYERAEGKVSIIKE